MFKPIVMTVVVVASTGWAGAASAQAPPAAPLVAAETPAPNDYGNSANWLCRPGRTDACSVDLATTVVTADGRLTREPWTAAANAPIDCFYAYPTVSTDTSPNSDMTANPAELNVVRQQFARFASVCRPYAPLYRQVTLAGLRRTMASGALVSLDQGLGYDDVRDAWRYYLEHDNRGRGVVLIGHSQGSFILTRLIRDEIEGTPAHARLISAILAGATVPVPRGRDVGGALKATPVCRSASQTGCVIAYSAFRSTLPPPANTLFGHVADPAMEAICVNPPALTGRANGALHAYLSANGGTIVGGGGGTPMPWVTPGPAVETPFVSVPDLLTARCASNEHANYLEITVHGDPADPRVDDIGGDLGGARPQANWGLHLVDVGLAMGDLVEIVRQQTGAYAKLGIRN